MRKKSSRGKKSNLKITLKARQKNEAVFLINPWINKTMKMISSTPSIIQNQRLQMIELLYSQQSSPSQSPGFRQNKKKFKSLFKKNNLSLLLELTSVTWNS
jgi:hypothetical protein